MLKLTFSFLATIATTWLGFWLQQMVLNTWMMAPFALTFIVILLILFTITIHLLFKLVENH